MYYTFILRPNIYINLYFNNITFKYMIFNNIIYSLIKISINSGFKVDILNINFYKVIRILLIKEVIY